VDKTLEQHKIETEDYTGVWIRRKTLCGCVGELYLGKRCEMKPRIDVALGPNRIRQFEYRDSKLEDLDGKEVLVCTYEELPNEF
jgi:hypothetical protein